MKIEVLIAIKSKGKKDISAILSSMNIGSDARVAVYHYNGAKEEKLDYKGHSVCIHYIVAGTKMAAYNELLKLADADVILFADPTQRFVSGYGGQIESAFTLYPKCDGVLFCAKKDGKRVGMKEARRHSFSALCMKAAVLHERGMAFTDMGDEAYNEGAADVFRHEFVAWPSRCAGKIENILTNDVPLECDEISCAFYDSHRLGILWPAASLIRFIRLDKKLSGTLRSHFRKARTGHRAYLFRGYEEENAPIKGNLLPFAVSIISMLGFAAQMVLSLLIVFTETQYIPIWVSLIFLVLFAIIYAFASSRAHNANAILANGIAISLTSFGVGLATYLFAGASWAMSIYGAFICLVVVFGLVYCFAPRRRKNICMAE